MPRKVRVLIVDDSALMRRFLADLIGQDGNIEIVGTARTGIEALEKVRTLNPDVVTMDIEMPEMDGLTALHHIMNENPLPVVMLSANGQREANITVKALRMGAVDFISKTSGSISLDIGQARNEIVSKIKNAAEAKVIAGRSISGPLIYNGTKVKHKEHLILIGASTGGPRALMEILSAFPGNLPAGVLIVQHMPEGFTHSFARHLDAVSSLEVREAKEGDEVVTGVALVSPGNKHIVVEGKTIRLNDGEKVHHVRPSVDVLMKSVAPQYGPRALGIILTGMGNDGAEGLNEIKKHGGKTIAQDKESSVVYGMPKAAVDRGAVDHVAPLSRIPGLIIEAIGTGGV